MNEIKAIKLSEKQKRMLSILLYVFFYFIVLFLHKNVFSYSDDSVFREYLSHYTIPEQASRTWNELSGKILTDTFGAILTLLPYSVWSILDSLVWLFMLIMFGDIIFGEPSYQRLDGTLMTASLFLMIPIYYMTSAGFMLTSSNYVYTAACDTFVIWLIIKKNTPEKSVICKEAKRASDLGYLIFTSRLHLWGVTGAVCCNSFGIIVIFTCESI
ncbi:MAG: hypothetical protein IKE56_07480 [Lachnospiraceae bacterium]|nr:hypothetical protein [Lachnospiraceae bacterium]